MTRFGNFGFLAQHSPLLAELGQTAEKLFLGKFALIEGLNGSCIFESNMMRLRIDETLADPRFIRDWLCSERAKQQIRAANCLSAWLRKWPPHP
jgi:hypothetical protein